MIPTHNIQKALAAALSGGGDFAEIFLEDSLSNNLSMVGGRIDSATTDRLHGAGIRVYKDLGSVYVHTSRTDLSGLLRAAKQAADAVGRAKETQGAITIADTPVCCEQIPVRRAPSDIAHTRKREYLAMAHAAAKGMGDAVAQVRCILGDKVQKVWVYNSKGLHAHEVRTRTRFVVHVVASNGHENQTGLETAGRLGGYELFDRIDPEVLGRDAACRALTMLEAGLCPAGEMPVVIAGGFGGVIFHEACGHSLEATSVALGNSEFCGKLGLSIASPLVTAIDDGTIPGAWGSIAMDDEGTPAGRLVLIEQGVLKNYMVDRLNGRRMDMPVTGSARRQSYACAPTSRMRNTYIAPGDSDVAEMISTMGDGLYAKRMGGGSVNPVTGEFNFSVSEGYLVRDGKIAKPVRGATLVGSGAKVLERIDRVGKDLSLADGICGSISGAVPVCVGQPTIRVSSMTVGGLEG